MIRRASIGVIMAAGVSLLAVGCDSGGGGGGGLGPVILITNQWRAEGNPDHRFDLDSFDDGRTEGAFTGEETLPRGNDLEFNELAGFWSDGEIQFTVDRSDGRVRYQGEFTEENQKRLEFTSSDGALVIVRD